MNNLKNSFRKKKNKPKNRINRKLNWKNWAILYKLSTSKEISIINLLILSRLAEFIQNKSINNNFIIIMSRSIQKFIAMI